MLISSPGVYSKWKGFASLLVHVYSSLQKHAKSKILKILPPKDKNFHIKNSDILQISAQNIDCGYSLELPQ